jgi:hypothetical protein
MSLNKGFLIEEKVLTWIQQELLLMAFWLHSHRKTLIELLVRRIYNQLKELLSQHKVEFVSFGDLCCIPSTERVVIKHNMLVRAYLRPLTPIARQHWILVIIS